MITKKSSYSLLFWLSLLGIAMGVVQAFADKGRQDQIQQNRSPASLTRGPWMQGGPPVKATGESDLNRFRMPRSPASSVQQQGGLADPRSPASRSRAAVPPSAGAQPQQALPVSGVGAGW